MIPGKIAEDYFLSKLTKILEYAKEKPLTVILTVGIILGILRLIKTAPKWFPKIKSMIFHKK